MKKINDSGQTLIALLVFMVVACTLTIGAIAVSLINLQSSTNSNMGQVALYNASSGIENALLSLQRNPNYTGGVMTMPSGTATISISGASSLLITSVGQAGNYQRTETASASETNGVWTITNWSETP